MISTPRIANQPYPPTCVCQETKATELVAVDHQILAEKCHKTSLLTWHHWHHRNWIGKYGKFWSFSHGPTAWNLQTRSDHQGDEAPLRRNKKIGKRETDLAAVVWKYWKGWFLLIDTFLSFFMFFLSKLTGKVVFHSFISCLTYSFGHVWRCLKQLSWPRNTKSTSINGWKAARIRTCHTEAQETHETRNGARRLPGAETQKASKSLAALASRSWDFSLTLRRCKQWEIDCVGICGFVEAFPAQNKSTWQGQNLCFRSFTFGHYTTSIHALKTS